MAISFILIGVGTLILFVMKRRAASAKRLRFLFALSDPTLFLDRRRTSGLSLKA